MLSNPIFAAAPVTLRISSSFSPKLILSRSFKSELKIKWVRPTKIPSIHPVKSGDLKQLPSINLKDFPSILKKSEELKSANDLVKRIFTLEFSQRNKAIGVYQEDMVKSVKKHECDLKSFESRIADMTATIRNWQELTEKNPTNRKLKVRLNELIDKRKKFLKYLRRYDYKKFEWLLEKLDLVYRPPPSRYHWITRKESLQKLTDKYCEDIKKERIEAYKEKLHLQKIDFLTMKVDKLKWIMEEEKACGVTPTVVQDDIDKVINQLQELKVKMDNIEKKED